MYENHPNAEAPPPPPATTSGRAAGRPLGSRPKQMTLDDIKKRDDDSEEEDGEKKQDMFAGGEKSGLAVQNPGREGGGPTDHFKNIMNQARQNRDRPRGANEDEAEPAQPPRSSNFGGRAQTLGGDDAPSEVVEDPRAARRPQAEQAGGRVSRTLHLWADGVSIDDGPLFRFDDPANAAIMADINRGRAPLALLDVQPDQEVDLNLEPHKGENYVQPKKKWKPFGGEGQRLGSPTPGPSGPSIVPQNVNVSQPSGGDQAKPEVDESQPTLQLQIRLGDGTRLQSRFNTTHTIGDVYNFVDRAQTGQRSYALMTTFPSKELTDRSLVLGEMGDFKRGGVVVQKWT